MSVLRRLEDQFSDQFYVLDRDQQNKEVFKVLKTEGLATYLVLMFIVLIASFGILGSNTMLVLDKKDDIKTLWHLGATEPVIKRIFFMETGNKVRERQCGHNCLDTFSFKAFVSLFWCVSILFPLQPL